MLQYTHYRYVRIPSMLCMSVVVVSIVLVLGGELRLAWEVSGPPNPIQRINIWPCWRALASCRPSKGALASSKDWLFDSAASPGWGLVSFCIPLHDRRDEGNLPALNKVLEIIAPINIHLGLILELRHWLSYNVCQEVDEASARLHLCTIRGEGETMLSNF